MRADSDFTVLVVVFVAIGYVIAGPYCLVWVSVPVALVAVPLAVLAGVAAAVVRALRVLAGAGDGLTARPGWRPSRGRRSPDWAWPEYFSGQVLLDLDAVVGWSLMLVLAAGAGAVDLVRYRRTAVLLGWPLALPAAAALVGFAVGVVAALAMSALVFAAVTAVAWAAGLVAIGLALGSDAVRRRDRTAICPHCYRVTGHPVYRCAGRHPAPEQRLNRDLHFDVRPGYLGVWWRRCGCGARLPTTVSRAAQALDACCPACLGPLPRDAAVSPEVRIPVFGAAAAGKTSLIDAAVNGLLRGPAVETLGVYRFRPAPADPAWTPAGPDSHPTTTSLLIRDGRRPTVVHLFDAPGADLLDPGRSVLLEYLDRSGTFAFVLDPMATDDPEDSYRALVSRLRQYAVDTTRHRLAIVVTKADLLGQPGNGDGTGSTSDSVRAWLAGRCFDNMVLAARRDFGEVRYFRCSTVDNEAAIAPIAWLAGLAG